MTTKSGLNYLGVEISYGSRWVNLNDKPNYEIAVGGDPGRHGQDLAQGDRRPPRSWAATT